MGDPFHNDISQPPATAAGTFTLFDPGTSEIELTHVLFSTDTAQRFVVGFQDADGFRVLAGWLSANGGAAKDMRVPTRAWNSIGKPLVVITTAASGFEASVEGCYLP